MNRLIGIAALTLMATTFACAVRVGWLMNGEVGAYTVLGFGCFILTIIAAFAWDPTRGRS